MLEAGWVRGEGVKMAHYNLEEQHAAWWWVHVCASVTTPQTWRPVSDRKANWQAQTHRSGESMGPARAYLLPMMKPNTMKTRMMVPATATTAMMMTGFCSLETVAAEDTETRSEPTSHHKLQSAEQTVMKPQWAALRLIPPSPPHLETAERGMLLFLSTHTAPLFQKVGLMVPDGSGDVLHLKQRHIQAGAATAEEAWDHLNVTLLQTTRMRRLILKDVFHATKVESTEKQSLIVCLLVNPCPSERERKELLLVFVKGCEELIFISWKNLCADTFSSSDNWALLHALPSAFV